MKRVLVGALTSLILGMFWAGVVTPVTFDHTFLGLFLWRLTSPWTLAAVGTGVLIGILAPRLHRGWMLFLAAWLIGMVFNLLAVWSLVGFSTGGEIITQQIPFSPSAIAQSPTLANEFQSQTKIMGYPYSVMLACANGCVMSLAARWSSDITRRTSS